MPFITEELWNELAERKNKEYIIVAPWPSVASIDVGYVSKAAWAFEIITQIRNVRASKGLSPKDTLNLYKDGDLDVALFWPVIRKLANVGEILESKDKPSGTSFLVHSTEFTVPLEGKIDVEKEKESVLKEIQYHKGFLASVEKKLGNEGFVKKASPQVIELERRKKADADSKIKTLEERLRSL